ncbi:MAG: hypothetical protein KKD05_11490 [Candidatus Omnitrophica bacterium]|nr:hypothetical protein [Candidatus Omnitrophota bacterium]
MANDLLNRIIFKDKYINRVNIGLMFFAGLILIYFSILFFSVQNMDIETKMGKKTMPAIASLELVKKSEKYYERILTRRKLFITQSGINSGQKKDLAVKTEQADLSLGQLQLLGIVSGAQGPQAIISNVTNDRSFYCYGNENVEGFIVKEVKSDRVILKKDDEIFELRL